jgi:hypothetical protein
VGIPLIKIVFFMLLFLARSGNFEWQASAKTLADGRRIARRTRVRRFHASFAVQNNRTLAAERRSLRFGTQKMSRTSVG